VSRFRRKTARMRPNFRREKLAYGRGLAPVAGCDEAGVSPLAGPVAAAAVILDPKRVPKGLDDSKKLTPERREELFLEICTTAEVAVAFAPPARIDRDNIFRARLWALAQAVRALPYRPALVYVDGPHRPPLEDDFCRSKRWSPAMAVRVDCRGFDRCQGDARPADVPARHRLSRLRLRAAQGLRHRASCRGARSPRADLPSSLELRSRSVCRARMRPSKPDAGRVVHKSA
jgi:hypothetical protein